MIALGLILLILNVLLLRISILTPISVGLIIVGVVLNFTPLLGGAPHRIY